MSIGIKDRVAVVGMGCTKFGERYDAGVNDLLVEAVTSCLESAGMELKDVDAFWFSTFKSGIAGTTFSTAMKTQYKPVTRLENMCCSGLDAFRNACYAVASGVVDVAMAVGVEKMKDGGYSGLTAPNIDNDYSSPQSSAPSIFALIPNAYCNRYNVPFQSVRDAMTHISWKSHSNGALNPRAMFRKEIPLEVVAKSPIVAHPLTVMDCSGVSDGAAAAIITRADVAKNYNPEPMYVKALQLCAGPGKDTTSGYDYTWVEEINRSAIQAYKEAGITKPREELSLCEVHDCFSITEMIICEDLLLSERGTAWKDCLDGVFDRTGQIPVNIDGGLKSFGHPIGASGLRMIFESWLQSHGQAGGRQLPDFRLGLAQNLGGACHGGVSGCAIVGKELG